jgi:crotonobetainyl-CoA:carnitine CoA-transferase CaiB-like acyl-CoA transferase
MGVVGSCALDDPRFATVALREAHALELIPILDGILATKDQAEWRLILDAADRIFGIVVERLERHARSRDQASPRMGR